MGLLADPEALGLEGLLHRSTGLEAVLTRELAALLVDRAILREDVDERELVAHAGLEIVEVVGRCHLDAAGAKLAVDHVVRDDLQLAVGEERMLELLADKLQVAVVLGVHRDGAVAEHGLQTRRGDHEEFVGTLDLVLELAQHAHLDFPVEAGDLDELLPLDVLVVHLQVGERGPQVRAEVDEAVAAVDEALLVEPDEGLLHGAAQLRVHGEAVAAPVDAGGDAPLLELDAVTVLLLPVPHLLEELLAPEVVPRLLLRLVEQLLHHALRRDARMVDARHPEGHVAAHPVPARQRVLDRPGERVAQVEGAGDVGRGDHHDEPLALGGLLGGIRVGREEPLLLPPGVPGRLDGLGVVPGRHGLRHVLLLALGRHNDRLDGRGRLRLLGLGLGLTLARLPPLGLLLHDLRLLLLATGGSRRGTAGRARRAPALAQEHGTVQLIVLDRHLAAKEDSCLAHPSSSGEAGCASPRRQEQAKTGAQAPEHYGCTA
mmetsp:Transcript_57524/g.168961  ORF Transcript_57524/g.168961 Transcript_57524/m.168961 type:complete len:488 (+) Transcript_57524:2047-3510(+)